jgi:hypothetical protein
LKYKKEIVFEIEEKKQVEKLIKSKNVIKIEET